MLEVPEQYLLLLLHTTIVPLMTDVSMFSSSPSFSDSLFAIVVAVMCL